MQFAWLAPSLLFGIYLGATTGAWHMLVMSSMTAAAWLAIKRFSAAREVDLSQPVTIVGTEAWIGDYQLPKLEILWKREWHDLVYRAYLAKDSKPEFTLDLQLETLGVHALIVGPTGSGKSELLKQLLAKAISSQPNCQLSLFDYKGGATFSQFSNLPQLNQLVTDVDGHPDDEPWLQLRAEVGRRELALAAKGASRIEDLQRWGIPMPRHYIFIDELAAVIAQNALASSALTMVATRGRSLGMHLVLATQSAQSVPRAMMTNLRTRIALAEADPIDLAQLNLKRPLATEPVPSGWAWGWFQNPGSSSTHFIFPIGAVF
jgi:S-DNA-T family DNA segregation ATPase FtsK/SpoIIIE